MSAWLTCLAWTLMVLLLWIKGFPHDVSTDEGFDLAVGVAAGDMDLQRSAILIEQHLFRR
ncbi:hypothetical protein [Arthrobacter sp. 2RAF6]|uniref:hypothetical protein n=1 Tax=Arthrobacter sp. 2RAF6 TaxID=3233002 RepID=UPI003F907205